MNASALTLKQLRVFTAVARMGTLTQAADQLSLTKAALSISLQELERQLGYPLFDRIKNRLVLNDRGLQLRPLADELLSRMAVIERLFAEEDLSGRLKIGASNTIGGHLLPGVVGDFLANYRCSRPELLVQNTASLCQRLVDFDLDLAFVEGRVEDERLTVTPWQQDQMFVVAAPNHPLVGQKKLPLSVLEDQGWVLREPKSGTREQFDLRLVPRLSQWRLALEFNSNTAVINAVAAGVGIGYISHLAAADALACGRIAHLDIEQRWLRELRLVYATERYHSPLMETFIRHSLLWRAQACIPLARGALPLQQ